MASYPQILLLGNGICRTFGGENWGKLIRSMHTNPRIGADSETLGKVPFPLRIILATDDCVDANIGKHGQLFCGVEDIDEMRSPVEALLDIGFDDILTTNYSYELERVIDPAVARDGRQRKRIARHTAGSGVCESRYLIHTYNELSYRGRQQRIWHIHGEARNPASIILGHYYYGKLLGMYQKHLDERKNEQFKRQQEGRPPVMTSWIDGFIMGDIYILGFGYDLSEMDLWWLLNRKKRENAAHGEVIFYEPYEGRDEKYALLEAYGVRVEHMRYRTKPENYRAFYEEAIKDIRGRVQEKRAKATEQEMSK